MCQMRSRDEVKIGFDWWKLCLLTSEDLDHLIYKGQNGKHTFLASHAH